MDLPKFYNIFNTLLFHFLKPKTFDIFYLQFDCENFFYLLDNFNVKNLIVTYISMHQKVNR